MTSFIAARGSGRSTSFIPAVPAAWSITTIAFTTVFSSVICLLVDRCRDAADSLSDFRNAVERLRIVDQNRVAIVRASPSRPHAAREVREDFRDFADEIVAIGSGETVHVLAVPAFVAVVARQLGLVG